MTDYLMLAKNGDHEIVVDRSRFICHAFRVYTVEEANHYINDIRELHDKANHHAVAYLIGEHNEFGRAADDGEPNKTAGAPMLEVLQRQNIRNCLVIVTRYFGGVKLGAGGLIRAYGGAVSETLKTIGLIRRIRRQSVWLSVDYSLFDTLQNRLKQQGYDIGQILYSERVKLETLVDIPDIEDFKRWVIEFSNDAIYLEMGGISFKELPLETE